MDSIRRTMIYPLTSLTPNLITFIQHILIRYNHTFFYIGLTTLLTDGGFTGIYPKYSYQSYSNPNFTRISHEFNGKSHFFFFGYCNGLYALIYFILFSYLILCCQGGLIYTRIKGGLVYFFSVFLFLVIVMDFMLSLFHFILIFDFLCCQGRGK